VARWQKGDCFDMSILLCSLLIGVGYDAFCVYGKAPREISTKNEALLECLYKDKGKYVETEEDQIKEKEINVPIQRKNKNKYFSEFDKKI